MNRKYLKKYCTGCGLCGAYADVAYEMDEKGFLTPVLDSKEKIEFCEKVCPAAKESMKLQDDRIWTGRVNFQRKRKICRNFYP